MINALAALTVSALFAMIVGALTIYFYLTVGVG